MKHAFKFHLPMPFLLFLLGACAATNSGQKLSPRDQMDRGIPACIAATGSVDRMIHVPADPSSLVNLMIASVVEMSGSNAIDAIAKLLSTPQLGALMVTGDDEDVTAANLRGALKKLSPDAVRPKASVCFVGDAKYAQGLKAAAEKSGVSVFIVQGK